MLKQTSCGLSVGRTGSIFYRYLRKELRQNNSELFTSKISKVIESIVNVGRVFSVSSCGFGNSICFAFSFEVFGFPWALEMDNFQNEIFPFWNLVTFIDICASYAIPSLFNVLQCPWSNIQPCLNITSVWYASEFWENTYLLYIVTKPNTVDNLRSNHKTVIKRSNELRRWKTPSKVLIKI